MSAIGADLALSARKAVLKLVFSAGTKMSNCLKLRMGIHLSKIEYDCTLLVREQISTDDIFDVISTMLSIVIKSATP